MNRKNQKGQVLLIGIIFMAVILILAAALFSRVASYLRLGNNDSMNKQAESLADAGVNRILWKLNTTAGACDSSCTQETAVGTTGTFEASITNKTSTLKTLMVTAYVPSKANPRAKRTVKVDVAISGDLISFRYAVQVGAGGLTMANTSSIIGNVFSNKTGQSITGSGSSQIQGDAYTVGTISSPDPSVTGLKRENQTASDMPTINYQEWVDAASANGTIDCSPTCTISNDASIGPKKYSGNLNISNNAIVTITGPIYVTGDLTISQGGTQIKLAESFGSTSTTLLVDGKISISQGATFFTTSASPKGYVLVASRSTASDSITLSNQGVNAIIYTLSGGANLSQSAHTTSLVAYSLNLSNSASLTYDQGLAGAEFSTGPGGSWQLKKGTYRYTQ
ncbi:hypothetical protein HY024_02875 [Candidatus Curtissbacteria bacterium]|nr:hypothetical protein [Candidatus Curtissbacteria bacterium]